MSRAVVGIGVPVDSALLAHGQVARLAGLLANDRIIAKFSRGSPTTAATLLWATPRAHDGVPAAWKIEKITRHAPPSPDLLAVAAHVVAAFPLRGPVGAFDDLRSVAAREALITHETAAALWTPSRDVIWIAAWLLRVA